MAHTTYRDPAITVANSPGVGTLDVPVTPASPLPVALYGPGGAVAPSGSSSDPMFTVETPSSASAAGIVPVQTGSAGSAATFKSGAGNLYAINFATGAVDGYFMIFDATSPPADGAVAPKFCVVMKANSSLVHSFFVPLAFVNGCTAVFSSTGPFLKTASATAYMSGMAK